ncbi:MAG: multidrug efflux pump subunit AcrA (membrane-fusion protein) [Mariniblastus sp.]|jgi:multidrug efflux pump subunit AcrA (membrane-fusion protein)
MNESQRQNGQLFGCSAIATGLLLGLTILFVGCSPEEEPRPPQPRPVNVAILTLSAPPKSDLVTASVAAWKTEEVIVEVAGQIEMIKEPNTMVKTPFPEADLGDEKAEDDNTVPEIVERVAQVLDRESDGEPSQGTLIAVIDPERYKLKVEIADADVKRANQAVDLVDEEIDESIPAQIRSAEVEKRLAIIERDRSQTLFNQKAGAKADVNRDEARVDSSIAAIDQLKSALQAKQLEKESKILQRLQSKQSLQDAYRELKNCMLFASLDGQISEIHVARGAVVTAGQSIATINLMNPIMVELEVSAKESRRLRHSQTLPISIEGIEAPQNGFLYLMDPVADSLTRTFTVTFLMLNKEIEDQLIDGVATTKRLWRLDVPFVPGAIAGKTYVNQEAILKDDEGDYLWRSNNVNVSDPLPADRLIDVSKMRVNVVPGEMLSFQGNWMFQEVEITDKSFDPAKNLVAGPLEVQDGEPDAWNGKHVAIGSRQWMLRPGDLVKIDFSNRNAQEGYFVPMNAILFEDGKKYLHLIKVKDEDGNESEPDQVERVEVEIPNDEAEQKDDKIVTSSRIRIVPVDKSISLESRMYVTEGTHYLNDDEPVIAVASPGGNQ